MSYPSLLVVSVAGQEKRLGSPRKCVRQEGLCPHRNIKALMEEAMQQALYLAYTGQQLETRGLFIWTQPELSIVIRRNGKLKLPCQEMEGVSRALG